MKLKEIGEFGFIERFKPMFQSLVPESQIGIGDDCAIIPLNESEDWLITTDLLLEDVHFLRNAISPEQLGYKSLAVNLSDIAAMGGSPVGSFLSLGIPPDIEVEYLDALMKGYQTLSSEYNTPLLGGDTTSSKKHLTINVCVIGKCPGGLARKRSMARYGDAVCVTGFLGDSAGGLQILLDKLSSSAKHDPLLHKHHEPEPRLGEGRFLAGYPEVHAMMDISDGIASDLNHILKASSVSARIHLDWLPVSEALTTNASTHGWNALELAAAGGEDYELLVTVAADKLEVIQKEFQERFGYPLTQIGFIEEGNPEISWYYKSDRVQLSQTGFDHFHQ